LQNWKNGWYNRVAVTQCGAEEFILMAQKSELIVEEGIIDLEKLVNTNAKHGKNGQTLFII
jgi:hypothetical protein